MSKILTGYADLNEVPAEQKQFYSKDDDGKIYYNAGGLIETISNLRKNETELKSERDELKGKLKLYEEIETSNEQADKKDDESEKPNAEAMRIAELEKIVQTMQSNNEKERQEKLKLQIQVAKEKAENAAGLKAGYSKLFDDRIRHDEGGLYVVDSDGTPMIDVLTGKRITLDAFYKQQGEKDPAILKDAANGAGFAGGGLNQNINQNQITATQTKELTEQYNQAVAKGDTKAMIAIRAKLQSSV